MNGYLAILDYAHLDNPVFLSSFARGLAEHQKKNIRPVIVHGDSEYTERIIQTGVMRHEAKVRGIKDLNRRLIALFADEGASTIGLNPYQRKMITFDDSQMTLDHAFFGDLPRGAALLVSTLAYHTVKQKPVAVSLAKMARFLHKELQTDEMIIFSKSDEAEILIDRNVPEKVAWKEMDRDFRKKQIPDELSDLNHYARLMTARDFSGIPNFDNAITLM